MKHICALAAVAMIWSWVALDSARTIRVPQDYSSIQIACDAANDGDGEYKGRINVNKAITLRSTFDGNDWNIVRNTIIRDGDPAVIYIGGVFKGTATIRGFTIRRDFFDPWGLARYRGLDYNNHSVNIEFNIIEGHLARRGGGSYVEVGAGVNENCGGIIRCNIFIDNRADGGSAIYGCNEGIIKNNSFYNNTRAPVQDCSSAIVNNTFYNNGSVRSDPQNPNQQPNGGISQCTGDIANNILWRSFDIKVGMYNPVVPEYCLVQGYTGGGEGNIDADPKFVNPEHFDFRLQPDSPCIDAGKFVRDLPVDLYGVPRGIDGTDQPRGDGSDYDIGAFEFFRSNAARPETWSLYQ